MSRKNRNTAVVAAGGLVNRSGSTVLQTFGRTLADEPDSNVYKVKLFFARNGVDAEKVAIWFRDRYISAKRKVGTRYQIRFYKTRDDAGNEIRYADWVKFEKMTDFEMIEFQMLFGDVTGEKVERDGKLRRPKLNKEEKAHLDAMIDSYYQQIAKERAERKAAEAAAGVSQEPAFA